METWYKRAVTADLDFYEAYSAKLYYLEPKWYGDPAKMLAFGQECLTQTTWASRVPFILIDAHMSLAQYKRERSIEYYTSDAVWFDMKAVYLEYLKRYPNAHRDRTFFARFACWHGDYATAKEQFAILGDNVFSGVFASDSELAMWREKVSPGVAPSRPAQTEWPWTLIGLGSGALILGLVVVSRFRQVKT